MEANVSSYTRGFLPLVHVYTSVSEVFFTAQAPDSQCSHIGLLHLALKSSWRPLGRSGPLVLFDSA